MIRRLPKWWLNFERLWGVEGIDYENSWDCRNPQLADYPICVTTQNSFPTAAGMASSASGLACLTKCLSAIYGVLTSPEEETILNSITRQASGSACRSLYGGLVKWDKGSREDGLDSIAHQVDCCVLFSLSQVLPSDSWPEFRIAVCIVSESRKSVGSTEGMNRCVETSPLMRVCVDFRCDYRLDTQIWWRIESKKRSERFQCAISER